MSINSVGQITCGVLAVQWGSDTIEDVLLCLYKVVTDLVQAGRELFGLWLVLWLVLWALQTNTGGLGLHWGQQSSSPPLEVLKLCTQTGFKKMQYRCLQMLPERMSSFCCHNLVLYCME